MSTELSLFLACSFAEDKVGFDGHRSDQGISDIEIARIVGETIEVESGGRIRVRLAKNPFDNYIPSKVREELAGADLMLCLFTRRTPIPDCSLWITSTFVVSEGAAFLMQLPTESETHRRLFGLMEEGVDPTQLGMAFPPRKTLPRFERMNREALRKSVTAIVQEVLGNDVAPRADREYVEMDKIVTICRDGRVQVETRHRFRFTKSSRSVLIPHTIWRVSRSLPDVAELIESGRDAKNGILKCLPLDCSHPGQRSCRLTIVPRRSKPGSNEYPFSVEVTGTVFKPGDELQYAIAWEYPDAFSAVTTYPNSVGLRCGERGIVQHASLTLQFERDLDEPDRILEDHPEISEATVTGFSLNQDPVDFWHSSNAWQNVKQLAPCRKRSGVRYEVYRWTKSQFHGMAKVTFTPHMNYFHSDVPRTPQATNAPGNVNESNEDAG